MSPWYSYSSFCLGITLLTAFRYREGAERALVRANFLSSQDITVLQAFVIYLVIILSEEQGGRLEVAYLISFNNRSVGGWMKMAPTSAPSSDSQLATL